MLLNMVGKIMVAVHENNTEYRECSTTGYSKAKKSSFAGLEGWHENRKKIWSEVGNNLEL